MSFTGKSPADTYKDIAYIDNNNSGITTTLKTIKTGEGSSSALSVSDRSLQVKSNTNNTVALDVQNTSGTSKLVVDTSTPSVKALGHFVNTQYANFGVAFSDTAPSGFSDDTHYAIPFGGAYTGGVTAASYAMGTATTSSFNDTEPASSLTIADTAHEIVRCYWFIMDNITVDRVVWWQSADASAGSSTAAYLMSYAVDTSTGSTGGDLSSGTKIASSSTVTNAGYEQAYYNQMTINSANITAGEVVLFTFCFDDTEATDYTLNATIKYHLT